MSYPVPPDEFAEAQTDEPLCVIPPARDPLIGWCGNCKTEMADGFCDTCGRVAA